MGPWLLEWLGLPQRGQGVELVLWGGLALLGAVLGWRERRARRPLAEGWLGWLLAAGLLLVGGGRAVAVAVAGASFLGPAGLLIPSYGVFMAGGLGLCVWRMVRLADARVASGEGTVAGMPLVDLAFWALIGGVLGARVLFMLTELPLYVALCTAPETLSPPAARDCLAALRFWDGGLVFYGSIPGGLLAGALWCRSTGTPFAEAADLVMTFVPLGHAIGRVGCWAAGCCFGAGCDAPWAVRYPIGSPAFDAHTHGLAADVAASWDASLPVHPTPLYGVIANLALFAWLRWGRVTGRGRGGVLAAWLVGYAGIRFVLEPFRGDTVRGFLASVRAPGVADALGLPPETVLALSTSQAVAALAAIAGVAMLIRLRRAA
jgi:phosphatidylglycerol---prolipoprotein diacylglyceryl transferase